MDKITIPELCETIEKEIVSTTTVCEFYIGKTDNIDRRREEHFTRDGYQVTLAVATSSSKVINEAEKQVIAYFKEVKHDPRIKNVRPGGEGADGVILYVSLKLDIQNVYEIEDLDIEFKQIKI